MIHFYCPRCGRKLKVFAEWMGEPCRCSACGSTVRVPILGPGADLRTALLAEEDEQAGDTASNAQSHRRSSAGTDDRPKDRIRDSVNDSSNSAPPSASSNGDGEGNSTTDFVAPPLLDPEDAHNDSLQSIAHAAGEVSGLVAKRFVRCPDCQGINPRGSQLCRVCGRVLYATGLF